MIYIKILLWNNSPATVSTFIDRGAFTFVGIVFWFSLLSILSILLAILLISAVISCKLILILSKIQIKLWLSSAQLIKCTANSKDSKVFFNSVVGIIFITWMELIIHIPMSDLYLLPLVVGVLSQLLAKIVSTSEWLLCTSEWLLRLGCNRQVGVVLFILTPLTKWLKICLQDVVGSELPT